MRTIKYAGNFFVKPQSDCVKLLSKLFLQSQKLFYFQIYPDIFFRLSKATTEFQTSSVDAKAISKIWLTDC